MHRSFRAQMKRYGFRFCMDGGAVITIWRRVAVDMQTSPYYVYDPVFMHSGTGIKQRFGMQIEVQGTVGYFYYKQ